MACAPPRAAIERLGARCDGLLRSHRPGVDGSVRDSAYYTITADQWPAVKARLAALTRGPRGPAHTSEP